jgi:ComF family protein
VRIRSTLASLASVVFPAPCRICGEILENIGALPVCEKCWSEFTRVPKPMCERCGRPFFVNPSNPAERTGPCRLCQRGTHAFDRARSYGIYNDAMHRAVLLLKHEEMAPFGSWFAERIAEIVRADIENLRTDVVVPVPLHRARLRERGYNQAELIAAPLARLLHLPCEPRALTRIRPRPDKLILSRSDRWKSVRGAYKAAGGGGGTSGRLKSRAVLLVDDVFTTGATLDACARALRKAGAAKVIGMTAARVVGVWDHPPEKRGALEKQPSLGA